jgi:hypothetical protein
MIYDLDAYYELANNINADIDGYDTGAGFEPVGNSTTYVYSGAPTNPFTGTFDGNGYVISGLTIHPSTSGHYYAGLFGATSGATLQNVGLTGVDLLLTITGGDSKSNGAGALVGAAYNTSITQAYSTGTAAAAYTGGSNVNFALGGLAGYLLSIPSAGSSTMTRCYSTATVNGGSGGSGSAETGGLVGELRADGSGHSVSVSQSYATGNVSKGAAKWANTGGLAGYAYGPSGGTVTISNSYATGNVTSTSGTGRCCERGPDCDELLCHR